MKRLYIDFDGVVMDTIPPLYSALEASGVDTKNEEEVRRFFATYDFDLIVNDENILNDSINCIKNIINSNKFEVSLLTHISSLSEGVCKVNYIKKYFSDMTIILVPKDISKTKMVHSKDAILIDDYSGNLKEWESQGGISIRFSKELESKGFKVINKLDEIINMFDENGNLL